MKLGGGLQYVEGPMGSGKSLYAVRGGVQAMCNGRYWLTNVELMPDAFVRIAKHVAPWRSKTKHQRMADRLRGFYVYETELVELRKYRIPGSGEARARMDWDEGHNDLNNRRWKDEGRAELLEWATQLRKLGLVGFLLSQHADNTDAALRRVCNFRIRLQNQREQTRLLGMRVTPWPLFLAVWQQTNAPLVSRTKPVRVERYFLSWHRNLYDTHGLYHGLAATDDTDTIMLPVGGRRQEILPPVDAIQAPTPGIAPKEQPALPPILSLPMPDATPLT